MVDVAIDGADIHSEADFHRCLEDQLELGPYYGRNLAALRDRLLTDVPRPIRLIWRNSDQSRSNLGLDTYQRITEILEEAQEQDLTFGWTDRFEYELQ